MALIRRVTVPHGGNIQVIPPDAAERSALYDWKVLNPTGSGGAVELVDLPSRTAGQGWPLAAGVEFDAKGRGERVWALNGTGSDIVVFVAGTVMED